MGTFYSGTMPAALAPEGMENLGAFYKSDLKSWAHFIAGLCRQPGPEHDFFEIAGAFTMGIENRGHIL